MRIEAEHLINAYHNKNDITTLISKKPSYHSKYGKWVINSIAESMGDLNNDGTLNCLNDASHNKTETDKTEQDKTETDKTEQDKTETDKTEQNTVNNKHNNNCLDEQDGYGDDSEDDYDSEDDDYDSEEDDYDSEEDDYFEGYDTPKSLEEWFYDLEDWEQDQMLDEAEHIASKKSLYSTKNVLIGKNPLKRFRSELDSLRLSRAEEKLELAEEKLEKIREERQQKREKRRQREKETEANLEDKTNIIDENNNKKPPSHNNNYNSSGTAFVYFPNFINKDESILNPKQNFMSNIISRIKRLNYMNSYKKLGPIPRQHLITLDTESIYKHQIPWRTRVLERVRFKTSQVAEEDDGEEYDDGYHFQDPDHENGRFYTYKRMIYSKGEPYFLKRVTNYCGNFANQKSILPISNDEEMLNTFLADCFASIKNWTVSFEVSAWTSNTNSFFYDYGIDSLKILKMSDEDFEIEKKTNSNFDTVVISNKPRLEKLLTNENLEKSLDKIGESTIFVKNYVTKTRSKIKSLVQPKTDEVVNLIKNLVKKPFKK